MLPVKEGWLFTLRSFEILAQDLILHEGFQWFATRRVNQDHLEVCLSSLISICYVLSLINIHISFLYLESFLSNSCQKWIQWHSNIHTGPICSASNCHAENPGMHWHISKETKIWLSFRLFSNHQEKEAGKCVCGERIYSWPFQSWDVKRYLILELFNSIIILSHKFEINRKTYIVCCYQLKAVV